MPQDDSAETYNPWTIVNVAFHHLVDEGLHPTFGDGGDPGGPAAELLRAFGIRPTLEGDARIQQDTNERLAQLRAHMLGEQ